MSLKAPFTSQTRTEIRERYYKTCSVCLQPVVSGQCAHLFRQAPVGQENVDEAIALGILYPDRSDIDWSWPYDRTTAENGTLQCPTCHLEYFTKGILVWSPPLELLQWTHKQVVGKRETKEIWKIFGMLDSEENFPSKLKRFFSRYSLIPIFKAKFDSKRYDLHCRLPPVSVVVDGEFRQDIPPRRGEPTFRIFEYWEEYAKRTLSESYNPDTGILSFFETPQKKDKNIPANYWWLPVSCGVILFLFIVEVRKLGVTADDSDIGPEIRLALQIYDELNKTKAIQDKRRAMDPKRGSGKETESSSEEDKTDSDDRPLVNHRPGHATPQMRRAQSEPLTGTSTRTPKAMCGRHLAKGHHRLYCSACYKVVRRVSPQTLNFADGEEPAAGESDSSSVGPLTEDEDEDIFYVPNKDLLNIRRKAANVDAGVK
ncbi:hypothetical protein C8R44DRAFT_870511 [Mycena epipterygia]|nr:hypothetical protein C8R44DRAFT_870511 [Mycena epipterygia]